MIPVHQTILADPARNDGHDATGQPGNPHRGGRIMTHECLFTAGGAA